jgi:hypothetical protein
MEEDPRLKKLFLESCYVFLTSASVVSVGALEWGGSLGNRRPKTGYDAKFGT